MHWKGEQKNGQRKEIETLEIRIQCRNENKKQKSSKKTKHQQKGNDKRTTKGFIIKISIGFQARALVEEKSDDDNIANKQNNGNITLREELQKIR